MDQIISEQEANQIVQLSSKIEAIGAAMLMIDGDDLPASDDGDFMQTMASIVRRSAQRIGKIGGAAVYAIERQRREAEASAS